MMYPSHACVSSTASYVSLKEEEEVQDWMYNLQAIKHPPDPPQFCCFARCSRDLPTCVLLLLLLFFFLFSSISVYALQELGNLLLSTFKQILIIDCCKMRRVYFVKSMFTHTYTNTHICTHTHTHMNTRTHTH